MPRSATTETRLSRQSWLQRSLEILREEGIQGVRIDRMARDLGVTKGSFYWHFQGLDDLQQSMLAHWTECYNDVIFENRAFLDAEPAAGLLDALTRVRRDGLDKYEVAMRNWADHDPLAEKVVAVVYEERTKFIRSFFTRMGFRGLDAEIRARTTLCYLSWEPNMYMGETPARRLKLLSLHLEMLTRK